MMFSCFRLAEVLRWWYVQLHSSYYPTFDFFWIFTKSSTFTTWDVWSSHTLENTSNGWGDPMNHPASPDPMFATSTSTTCSSWRGDGRNPKRSRKGMTGWGGDWVFSGLMIEPKLRRRKTSRYPKGSGDVRDLFFQKCPEQCCRGQFIVTDVRAYIRGIDDDKCLISERFLLIVWILAKSPAADR